MKKTILKFGLLGGVFISLFMLCTMPFMDENTDMGHSMLIGYLSMVIALGPMFIGIKNYRDKQLGGTIGFGKAFLVGLGITVVTSTLYVVTWMILSEFFLTDFMADYTAASIESIKASDLSPKEIEAQITEAKNMAELYKNPVFKALITYIEILPVGVLISCISASILQKK